MPKVSWLVPMTIYVMVAYVVLRLAVKHLVSLHSRTKRLFLQYLFCAMFATIFAWGMGHLRLNSATAVVMLVGLLNGFACYGHWKAIDVSLSKTALFTFWDDLIAMSLSFIILREGRLLSGNWSTILGIGLCLTYTILMANHSYKTRESMRFFAYTAFYSVMWGIAMFAERFFAFKELPVGQFLTGWYWGALIAATCLVLFYKDPDKSQQNNVPLTRKDVLGMFAYASGITYCLWVSFWIFTLAPQVVAQPVMLVGEAVVPAIVGFVFFGEHKTFDRAQWYFVAIGIAGILLIALGFK